MALGRLGTAVRIDGLGEAPAVSMILRPAHEQVAGGGGQMRGAIGWNPVRRFWDGRLLVVVLLLVGAGAGLAANPPSALAELIGGGNPTQSDRQWARVIVGLLVFVGLLTLAMVVAIGLPDRIKAFGLEISSSAIDRRAIRKLTVALEETKNLAELLSQQVEDLEELATRPDDRVNSMVKRLDDLETAVMGSPEREMDTGEAV
jgi:hypothetical protein